MLLIFVSYQVATMFLVSLRFELVGFTFLQGVLRRFTLRKGF
jgi:hypothetical protein